MNVSQKITVAGETVEARPSIVGWVVARGDHRLHVREYPRPMKGSMRWRASAPGYGHLSWGRSLADAATRGYAVLLRRTTGAPPPEGFLS